MNWLKKNKMMVAFVGVIAVIALGSNITNAYIIMSERESVGPPILRSGEDPQGCDFSADGLELYFASTRSGGHGSWDIWVAKRDSLNDPWQEPVNLGSPVNNGQGQVYPTISPDGLEIYYNHWQQPYLYVARRTSRQDPWSTPEKVLLFADDSLNRYTQLADVSGDGLSLYFTSHTVSGKDTIYVAARASREDPWEEPTKLGPPFNMGIHNGFTSITADGLTMVFARDQNSWLWATTRRSVEDDWGPLVDLGFGNLPSGYDAAISPDGSTLYIDVHPPRLLQVTFQPVVDLDEDGIVGIGDLRILVDNWGKEDPVYDLAPLPLGDGIIDEKDLEMLMSYWGNVAHDTTLIDNFNDGDADGWTIVDFTVGQPWGPGTFDASSGAYHFEGGGLVPVGSSYNSFLSAMWDQSSDPGFTDGFVRATIRAETQGSIAGIMLRSTPGNFYAFLGTTHHGGQFLFNRLANGSIEQVRQLPDDLSFGLNEDWNIEAGAVGDQLSMTVWRVGEPKPETPQLTFTDSTFSSGGFGIATGIDDDYSLPARVSATFDNIYFVPADVDNSPEQ